MFCPDESKTVILYIDNLRTGPQKTVDATLGRLSLLAMMRWLHNRSKLSPREWHSRAGQKKVGLLKPGEEQRAARRKRRQPLAVQAQARSAVRLSGLPPSY